MSKLFIRLCSLRNCRLSANHINHGNCEHQVNYSIEIISPESLLKIKQSLQTLHIIWHLWGRLVTHFYHVNHFYLVTPHLLHPSSVQIWA
ncbi:uncharacterized protein YALI1_B01065g [Yarrowia lipolytica]|uniref:Uncharacterized protein n=1 Tax=Yarrowia lipolytica TaxID=4952 RepID=A0A1D8N5W0_YARLL|nr:hypothetical protein YALI1_B01065g [Yarrowia lipolytica]